MSASERPQLVQFVQLCCVYRILRGNPLYNFGPELVQWRFARKFTGEMELYKFGPEVVQWIFLVKTQ